MTHDDFTAWIVRRVGFIIVMLVLTGVMAAFGWGIAASLCAILAMLGLCSLVLYGFRLTWSDPDDPSQQLRPPFIVPALPGYALPLGSPTARQRAAQAALDEFRLEEFLSGSEDGSVPPIQP